MQKIDQNKVRIEIYMIENFRSHLLPVFDCLINFNHKTDIFYAQFCDVVLCQGTWLDAHLIIYCKQLCD